MLCMVIFVSVHFVNVFAVHAVISVLPTVLWYSATCL